MGLWYGMNTTNASHAAAQALAAKGMTSRQRGEEKERQVLEWVYRWRWVAPSLIPQIVGAKSKALGPKLVRQGYLCEVTTHAGTVGNGYPEKLLFLTKEGRARLIELGFEAQYDFAISKIFNAANLKHDSIVQRLTLNWLQAAPSGVYREYTTPAELKFVPAEYIGHKRPDALWIQQDSYGAHETLALELELNPKHRDRLMGFINGCLSMRHALQPMVKAVVVVALADKAVLRSYAARVAPGQTRAVWDNDARAYGDPIRISESDSRFFRFAKLAADYSSPESLAVAGVPEEMGRDPYCE